MHQSDLLVSNRRFESPTDYTDTRDIGGSGLDGVQPATQDISGLRPNREIPASLGR